MGVVGGGALEVERVEKKKEVRLEEGRRKVERWRKRETNCERERERMRDSPPLPHRKRKIGNKGSW